MSTKLKTKMLKTQNSKLKTFKGFTIVELLVAMGLFVVLIGISTGGFIKALQTQKAIISLMEANDNAGLALEQIAREIRTGYNFSKISDTELQFVNQRNQVIWYRLNEEAIERGTEKEGVVSQRIYKKITADNVKIKSFKVALFGSGVGDGYPPRITISLSVGPTGRYLENILTNIQTTISARTLDS
ncbi:MAG: prepilin-type N-terminal cleavage/methylation domain-containing protein [Patescibacteria group bacterium]